MKAAAQTEPAAPPQLPEDVVILDVAKIRRCEHQPRQHDRKPDFQFIDSVRVHGVLQPIVVTAAKADGFYDLVFGEMRWTACKLTGREQIPAIVRVMEPNEIYEVQVIENSARKDVHPLDEADAFAELIKRGYTAERIAGRLGRPVAYVAQRLKLRELSKECRKALDEERITLSVAVLLARIPDAKLQGEALDEVGGNVDWGRPMTADKARKAIEDRFMLRLDQAPFDITSVELVPKAGACTACPKRTGQQRELFADASSPDLCTDPPCHTSKVDALWKIKVKDAKAGGVEVLEGKAADKAISYGSPFRDLAAKEWIGSKQKTVKQLLGKDLPPVTLARDSEGVVHELVAKKDTEGAIRKATGEKASSRGDSPQAAAANKRQREKEAIAAEATRSLVAGVVNAVEGRTVWKGMEIGLLRGLVMCVMTSTWSEYHRQLAKRRGWLDAPAPPEGAKSKKKPKNAPAVSNVDAIIEGRIDVANHQDLAGILVEGLMARELPSTHRDELDTGAALICQALGISYEKELARVQKEFAAKKAAKSVGKSVAKAKAKGAHRASKSSPGDDKSKPKPKSPKAQKPKSPKR